jgi:hypothetical protein
LLGKCSGRLRQNDGPGLFASEMLKNNAMPVPQCRSNREVPSYL